MHGLFKFRYFEFIENYFPCNVPAVFLLPTQRRGVILFSPLILIDRLFRGSGDHVVKSSDEGSDYCPFDNRWRASVSTPEVLNHR